MAADFDPDSGRALVFRAPGSTVNETLLNIHNTLALGHAGMIVMLLTGIGVVLLAISGFVAMRRRWRTFTTSPVAGPAPLASLHKWTGLVGLACVLLWALTGILLLSVKSLGSSRPERPRAPSHQRMATASLRPMLETALRRHPGTEIQGIMPSMGGRPTTVMLLDRRASPWAKSLSVPFDARGKALPERPANGMAKLMLAAKSLHTGLWGSQLMPPRALLLSYSCAPFLAVGQLQLRTK